MKGKRKKRYDDNDSGLTTDHAGFSLIELLIAVTILSIIAVPLLHMFVTSSGINAKSKRIHSATMAAQDIMEGLKAYTLEEVRAQFQPPKDGGGSSYYLPGEEFHIVSSAMTPEGIRDLTKLMPQHRENDGVYYFGMENVKGPKARYDVLIKLDASTYGVKAKDRTRDPQAVHDSELNGRFYAQIGSINEINGSASDMVRTADSSYHQSKQLDEDVLKDIKQQIEDDILADGGKVPEDLDGLELDDLIRRRLIKVTIEDAHAKDAAGNEQCLATVTFLYEYAYGGMENKCLREECPFKKGTAGHPWPHSHGYAASGSGEVYAISRTFSSGNFYLFYYPYYAAGKRIDEIEFEIKDKDKLLGGERPMLRSITLVKQIRSEADPDGNVIMPEFSDLQLREKESNYQAEVRINTHGKIEADLIYRTNLDMNMADDSEIDMGMINQFFDDMVHIQPQGFAGDGLSSKITNLIYDIEISVYETGAAKHFTESNFEDNDEVHRIATITNLSAEDGF